MSILSQELSSSHRYKILIVEDSIADFELYEYFFNKDDAYQYSLIHCETAQEALESFTQENPDIVFIDFSLPDMDGLQLLEAIHAVDKSRLTPIVMLTGLGNEAIALEAMKKNICNYLIKGELNFNCFISNVYQIIAALENSKTNLQTKKKDLLLVDDSEADLKIYSHFINKGNNNSRFNIYMAQNSRQALEICSQKQLDIIIVDYRLKGEDGITLIKKIRRLINYHNVPIIMITGQGSEKLVVEAIKSGADDYLVKHHLTSEGLCQSIENVLYESIVHQEINEANFKQRLLSQISLKIRQSLDLQEILDTSVTEVRKFIGCERVLIYKIVPPDTNNIIAESVDELFTKTLGMNIKDSFFDLSENRDEYLCECRKQVINDIELAQISSCHRQLLERFEVKSIVSLPITIEEKSNSNFLWGLLIVHFCKQPHYWQQSEIAFLNEIVLQIAIAVKQGLLVEQIQQERDKARQATEAKSIFLANMSHEIRTPMNGILGMAELASLCDLDEPVKHYIDIIQSTGKSLLNLINSVLDLSKLESRTISLKLEEFVLEDLIQDVINLFQISLTQKNLQINLDIPEDLPKKYRGDSFRLQQILTNLIGNAIKFTIHDKAEIKIRVRQPTSTDIESQNFPLPASNQIILYFEIEDMGIGISKENQKKLFQPFSQVENLTTKNFEGTGLGLSICRKLVELMEGKIGVESKLDRGSTFWFWVQLTPLASSVTPIFSEDDAVPEFIPNSKLIDKTKVLIVEDNKVNQKVLKLQLKKIGYDSDIASDGKEALKLLEQNFSEYQFVLMDCQMPILDGYETTIAIRNNELTKNTIVIGLTAFAMEVDKQKCLDAGMNAYLAKPCNMKSLQTVIRQQLHLANSLV